jgi:hypothetical protein
MLRRQVSHSAAFNVGERAQMAPRTPFEGDNRRVQRFSRDKLENVMSSPKTIRRSEAATVMLTVLSLTATRADTYHFKDVLRPHGHQRSLSAKFADGRSCGASGSHFSGDVTGFEQCMRAHGWVVDRYTPDPKPRVGANNDSSTYIDPDTGMSCGDVGGIAICDRRRTQCTIRTDTGSIARGPASCPFARIFSSIRTRSRQEGAARR